MTQGFKTCTHKGWLGVCPVYLADLEKQDPFVEPRWPWLRPVFNASVAAISIYFLVRSAADGRFDPQWPIRVTGELAEPVQVKLLEDPGP